MGVGKTVQAIALASCFRVRQGQQCAASGVTGREVRGDAACAGCDTESATSLDPQEEWPLLIVVPASLRLVWAEELEKWMPHQRPSSVHVIECKEHRLAQVRGGGNGLSGLDAPRGCSRNGDLISSSNPFECACRDSCRW